MEDEVYYCHEIARRSVARAALHLGLKDGMSQDSLDVLADILLKYIEQIGKTASHLVESAGRPSSHANVLDALQAIHMTTAAAAVLQVNLKEPSAEDEQTTTATTASSSSNNNSSNSNSSNNNSSNNNNNSNRSANTAPWKDLAVFCFGPKWQEEKSNSKRNLIGANHIGGKVLPVSGTVPPPQQATDGWVAPYLEEVPTFPMTTTTSHQQHTNAALLHVSPDEDDPIHADNKNNNYDNAADADQEALNNIPDKVFTEWGTIDSNKEADDGQQPPNKKQKMSNDDRKEIKLQPEDNHDDITSENRPPHVPSFMPAFPQSLQSGRSMIVDLPDTTTSFSPANNNNHKNSNDTAAAGVRSSLVDLGQASSASYWGSGWDHANTTTANTPSSHKVAAGKSAAAIAAAEAEAKGQKTNTATILPLKLSSVSRISRILEGSMD